MASGESRQLPLLLAVPKENISSSLICSEGNQQQLSSSLTHSLSSSSSSPLLMSPQSTRTSRCSSRKFEFPHKPHKCSLFVVYSCVSLFSSSAENPALARLRTLRRLSSTLPMLEHPGAKPQTLRSACVYIHTMSSVRLQAKPVLKWTSYKACSFSALQHRKHTATLIC